MNAYFRRFGMYLHRALLKELFVSSSLLLYSNRARGPIASGVVNEPAGIESGASMAGIEVAISSQSDEESD